MPFIQSKCYIIDAVIGGTSIQYSFQDKQKMEEYIKFLYDKVPMIPGWSFEYQLREEFAMEVTH